MATARTVRQILEGALRKIGVLAPGETASSEDTSSALIGLQDLIAEWSDGGLLIPCLVVEKLDLVAAQASYTIGENGSPDLSTVRPEQIIGAYVRSSSYDYPVTIIGEEAYSAITNKTTGGRPEFLWYNPTSPNGTIYLYYTPNDSSEDLYITSLKPLTEPTGLTQNVINAVQIPRNYHNALVWNLACELAPDYGFAIDPVMEGKAIDKKNRLISLTVARRVQPAALEIEPMVSQKGTILNY